ncbi:hypothetical protein CAPTEDRAFT_223152 [Capitella teleta]|uniref:Uncharacterized protein n=1 Tax=Capitella teleta TaxID=283909 RepID=R7V254_CAPTE|nr:hypothetical protein CAPTEDRAFT_223152 [Capitella teleta]|eukprot:ELU12933.1 hypothetical protein CAPTEDRAFT_223152 [Capitella teleta]
MNLNALLGAILVSGSISGILFIVGYVAPYWTWVEKQGIDTHTGLWQWCGISTTDQKEMCGILESTGDWPDWLRASQGVLSASLFFALLSMITTVVWSFRGPSKYTCIICCVFFLISALLSLTGACLYGDKNRENLSWAFAFPLVAAFLYLLPALLSAIAARQVWKETPDK